MARFVLIHGSFAGGWSWELVVAGLEARGHVVEAPDLPGAGDDETPVADVTLDGYAARICDVLARSDEPAILVGHSMGGMAITQAAARCPGRVAELVYVCAFLPDNSDSLVALTKLPEGAGDRVQEAMVVSGEPPVATMSDEDSIAAFFHLCDPERAAAAVARYRPQPVAAYVTPVELGEGGVDALPRRSFIVCSRDQSLPPPLQRRMARERANGLVVEIDTDHSPFFSAPAELVADLDGIASDRYRA